MFDLIIIGAGPAGLTAAYELRDTEKNILIVEKKSNVGGLAETKTFENYKYDIGPHRFFTKNEEVNRLFTDILGSDAVEVDRLTRILYKKKFFNYPLTPLNAFFGLGILESISATFSYFFARVKSILKLSKINNFEDWIIDRFGKKLFNNFFKNYTEKVWGIDCKEIGSDWASQRIKGLSLSSAIKYALFPNSKSRPKTLINKFYYPRLGAGMLWDKFENIIKKKQIQILKNTSVKKIKKNNDFFTLTLKNDSDKEYSVNCKNIFFSNPLLQFIKIFQEEKPNNVIESVNSLGYRHHISLHLTIDKKLFQDNWIYIHSPELKLCRIADFSNFSKDMSPPGTYPLTLEYFCFENDTIWNEKDENIVKFGVEELYSIFKKEFKLLHSAVTRNKNAYPIIKKDYETHINVIKNWLSNYENITPIGRSGMFKYNNQDHAMATGLYASRKFLGIKDFDPWLVNIDGEYHEESSK